MSGHSREPEVDHQARPSPVKTGVLVPGLRQVPRHRASISSHCQRGEVPDAFRGCVGRPDKFVRPYLVDHHAEFDCFVIARHHSGGCPRDVFRARCGRDSSLNRQAVQLPPAKHFPPRRAIAGGNCVDASRGTPAMAAGASPGVAGPADDDDVGDAAMDCVAAAANLWQDMISRRRRGIGRRWSRQIVGNATTRTMTRLHDHPKAAKVISRPAMTAQRMPWITAVSPRRRLQAPRTHRGRTASRQRPFFTGPHFSHPLFVRGFSHRFAARDRLATAGFTGSD